MMSKRRAPKVHLRSKPLTKGRQSLFLDFWPPVLDLATGKETRREFLGLFTYDKPRTPDETRHNRETRALAEAIRAQRQLDVQNSAFDFAQSARVQTGLIHFLETRAAKKGTKTRATWLSAAKILRQYWPNDVALGDLDKHKVCGFREYLAGLSTLANSSKGVYLAVLKTTIKDAYKLDYLNKDLTAFIDPIKSSPAQREYLTLDEFERLAATPCERLDLRNAFLFSCVSGLRYSDVTKLTWGEVQGDVETGFFLRYTQQKTKNAETLPIAKIARELLGPAGLPQEKVFPTLPEKLWGNYSMILQRWFLAAGISRKITYHSSRHTYATGLLSSGIALEVVSKMLGHTDTKTTAIYARIIDERRRAAADTFDKLKIK
jgi:integrase